MHEASLAQGLLNIVLDEVEKYCGQNPGKRLRVKEIKCELGLMSCVEEQTLKGCFELLAEDTAAKDAALLLGRAPLPCACQDCGADFEMKKREFFCPRCGGANIRFNGGQGLTLVGLAVECEDMEQ